MKNDASLSNESVLVVRTVIQGTKTTINEIQEQKNSHSFELNLIRRRLSIIENNMVRLEDLSSCKEGIHSELAKIDFKLNAIDEKMASKSDIDSLKTFVKENVAMKSDVDSISRKTVEWVNQNTATKADLLKTENTLLWKIVGFVALIVGATATVVKMFS